MENAIEVEESGVPAPVGIAAIIGLGKAAFEILFGVLGVAVANSMDDSFGGGILVFGIAYALLSWLLLRGNRAGYYGTMLLSLLGLVVSVIYLVRAESFVFGGTFVTFLLNALVLYLLWRKSARAYFMR